ncbi:MAG: hypothetical protein ACRCST_17290 [Turicibacter sp.]
MLPAYLLMVIAGGFLFIKPATCMRILKGEHIAKDSKIGITFIYKIRRVGVCILAAGLILIFSTYFI